mmetsp:Transcript_15785/g.36548  ORF Transcript_15785/g.36548 Transcript_15785/m.36548 type:complete len:97 (+) Transcript_15785:329-619(+)
MVRIRIRIRVLDQSATTDRFAPPPRWGFAPPETVVARCRCGDDEEEEAAIAIVRRTEEEETEEAPEAVDEVEFVRSRHRRAGHECFLHERLLRRKV